MKLLKSLIEERTSLRLWRNLFELEKVYSLTKMGIKCLFIELLICLYNRFLSNYEPLPEFEMYC